LPNSSTGTGMPSWPHARPRDAGHEALAGALFGTSTPDASPLVPHKFTASGNTNSDRVQMSLTWSSPRYTGTKNHYSGKWVPALDGVFCWQKGLRTASSPNRASAGMTPAKTGKSPSFYRILPCSYGTIRRTQTSEYVIHDATTAIHRLSFCDSRFAVSVTPGGMLFFYPVGTCVFICEPRQIIQGTETRVSRNNCSVAGLPNSFGPPHTKFVACQISICVTSASTGLKR
jgi:hypothetical protein